MTNQFELKYESSPYREPVLSKTLEILRKTEISSIFPIVFARACVREYVCVDNASILTVV